VSQQVNLYQPIFRKQKIIFSARTIAFITAGLLLLLVIWGLVVGQRINQLETEYQRQVAAEQRAVEQLTELQRNRPPPTDTSALEADIEALRQRAQELRASLSSVQQHRPVSQTQLPERLDALARQVPRGLWLTRLTMTEPDRGLTIEGRALSSGIVPNYIEGLSSEPLIIGTGFKQVQVQKSTDDKPGVEFVMRTQTGDAP
jgi:Tfp pilus assembly protein PilN